MVILYGPTALAFLRQYRDARSRHAAIAFTAEEIEPPSRAIVRELQNFLQPHDGPLHFMIAGKEQFRKIRGAVLHSDTQPFPPYSFHRAPLGLAMPNPCLAYIQMANVIPFVDHILLGYELCGFYSMRPDGGPTYKLPPAVSLDELTDYCRQASNHKGGKKAKGSLKYVESGAASPAESAIYLLLCLPCSVGGFGFPRGVLNGRVDVSDVTGTTFGKDFRFCDILWAREKVVLEYDSSEFHSTGEKADADAARRTILQAAGYSVITVTRSQIKSLDGMTRVAQAVRNAARWNINPRVVDYEAKQAALYAKLFRG